MHLSSTSDPNNRPPRGHSLAYKVSLLCAMGMIVGAWGVFTFIRAKGLLYELRTSGANAAEVKNSFTEETSLLKNKLKQGASPPNIEAIPEELVEEPVITPEEKPVIDQSVWIEAALVPNENHIKLIDSDPSLTDGESQ